MGSRGLYPPIDVDAQGFLAVAEGHEIYWETCGDPAGKPVVFLHGGPGNGSTALDRRLFDPAAYRIVLLDQRNCGRSRPHAGRPEVDLSLNTTSHLIEDLERLREHLRIERWQLFGGSWGSTLALAYAQAYPERVTELVVRGVYLVLAEDEPWCFAEGGVSRLYPDEWEQFRDFVPAAEQDDLIAAYARRLASPDPGVHGPAARAWTRWEDRTAALLPRPVGEEDLAGMIARARLENRYFGSGCFLEPGQLLRDMERIAHIPGVIVNGRYDLLAPPDAAWALHKAWPASELHLVPDAGHAVDEPGILHQLIEATDRFRRY